LKIEKIIFNNRNDAAQQLYDTLPISDMKEENWIVLATSAGGVPIALEIAHKINSKFDFLFTEKIFTKKNSNCEVAIITETQEVVIHEELLRAFGLNLEKIYRQSKKLYIKNISEYKRKYRDNLDIIDLNNKNVLLIDEGLNTGLTMMACIKSVITNKAKSICVAVPILPQATVSDIESIADDLYFVHAPAHFLSIDFYYENLEQIELEDIEKLRNNYKKENNVDNM